LEASSERSLDQRSAVQESFPAAQHRSRLKIRDFHAQDPLGLNRGCGLGEATGSGNVEYGRRFASFDTFLDCASLVQATPAAATSEDEMSRAYSIGVFFEAIPEFS
jgi:hypothetical protein